jgi:hypothetical protein
MLVLHEEGHFGGMGGGGEEEDEEGEANHVGVQG